MEDFQSRERRLKAVLNLEKPDRIPIMPKISWFAARYSGITAEEYVFQRDKTSYAVHKTWQDYGGWDIVYGTMRENAALTRYQMGLKCLLPGKELPSDSPIQYLEQEVMKEDDYGILIQKGWKYFNRNVFLPRLYPGLDLYQVDKELQAARSEVTHDIQEWVRSGVPVLVGGNVRYFASHLCYARSLPGLVRDMFRCPDKIMAYAEAQTPLTIEEAKNAVKETGIRRVFIGGSRVSCDLVSPKKWDSLVWPYLKRIVEELYADGIIAYLHWDGDWIKSTRYLTQLPKGSCLVDFDGYTDIFQAKEILKGHICIAGDVPHNLLVMGTSSEVTEYCKKLIDVVGDGGGFILSSGCDVPVDAKPENVRAMIEAVSRYGVY